MIQIQTAYASDIDLTWPKQSNVRRYRFQIKAGNGVVLATSPWHRDLAECKAAMVSVTRSAKVIKTRIVDYIPE